MAASQAVLTENPQGNAAVLLHPETQPRLSWFAAAQGDTGWLLSGQTDEVWPAFVPSAEARFQRALLTGEMTTAFVNRGGKGSSFLSLLRAPRPPCGELQGLSVAGISIRNVQAPDVVGCVELDAKAAGRAGRQLLNACSEDVAAAELRAALPAPTFNGADTLAALGLPLQFKLEAAIRVPPDGMALSGTLLDPMRLISRVGLRQGSQLQPLDRASWAEFGLADSDPGGGVSSKTPCGFVAYVELPATPALTCLEIETQGGDIAHVPLPPVSEGSSLAVIQHFLGLPRAPLPRMHAVISQTIGPIVRGLNRARLANQPEPRRLEYGETPSAPARSLIIPLHGRIDFMPLQLALFSARPDATAEIIYVLDDPGLWSEAERMAQSCWVRFGVPFILLDLGANLGYAPANNAGLRIARGRDICLLNSDVFPRFDAGMNWLAELCAPLQDPSVGAVGALLLFEDGTVQHEGMAYHQIPSLPAWPFPLHPRKGRQPDPNAPTLTEVAAVTGACLAVRRDSLTAVGGLDEDCIIADFEDACLCEALRARGQRIMLRRDVVLHHLERQTPGSGAGWRFGATMVNASYFAARWHPHASS